MTKNLSKVGAKGKGRGNGRSRAAPRKEVKANLNSATDDRTGESSATETTVQPVLVSARSSSSNELLYSLFHRYLDCEEQIGQLNAVKAAIYAEGGDKGLDKDSIRQAFRQHARERKNPEVADRYNDRNEHTDSYLRQLRNELLTSSAQVVGEHDMPEVGSPGAAEGEREIPASSRQEKLIPSVDQLDAPNRRESSPAFEASKALNAPLSAPGEEPDIPDFLRTPPRPSNPEVQAEGRRASEFQSKLPLE